MGNSQIENLVIKSLRNMAKESVIEKKYKASLFKELSSNLKLDNVWIIRLFGRVGLLMTVLIIAVLTYSAYSTNFDQNRFKPITVAEAKVKIDARINEIRSLKDKILIEKTTIYKNGADWGGEYNIQIETRTDTNTGNFYQKTIENDLMSILTFGSSESKYYTSDNKQLLISKYVFSSEESERSFYDGTKSWELPQGDRSTILDEVDQLVLSHFEGLASVYSENRKDLKSMIYPEGSLEVFDNATIKMDKNTEGKEVINIESSRYGLGTSGAPGTVFYTYTLDAENYDIIDFVRTEVPPEQKGYVVYAEHKEITLLPRNEENIKQLDMDSNLGISQTVNRKVDGDIMQSTKYDHIPYGYTVEYVQDDNKYYVNNYSSILPNKAKEINLLVKTVELNNPNDEYRIDLEDNDGKVVRSFKSNLIDGGLRINSIKNLISNVNSNGRSPGLSIYDNNNVIQSSHVLTPIWPSAELPILLTEEWLKSGEVDYNGLKVAYIDGIKIQGVGYDPDYGNVLISFVDRDQNVYTVTKSAINVSQGKNVDGKIIDRAFEYFEDGDEVVPSCSKDAWESSEYYLSNIKVRVDRTTDCIYFNSEKLSKIHSTIEKLAKSAVDK